MSTNRSQFAETVNANIKAELARRDIPDALVIAATRISPDTLRRRKRGETAWTLDDIAAIAALLEVEPETLTRT